MAKVIMIQGTMSNAGKSLLAAGLCRIFRQDGYRVAPFKSQNMALNSYITRDGLEMGRAQAVQAEAAGCEPEADMNPVLLKPSSDMGSQVIVCGEVVGTMEAKAYFAYKKQLIPQILSSYQRLAAKNDIIVIEGAGSPAEINLKQDDIVNMGLARLLHAPVLLAGDIDRGGVFAQLYGTVMLLEPEERALIKGLIINKFRGDPRLLDSGVTMIESLCGIPVTGVVPFADVDIEDEDSLSTRLTRREKADPYSADIAVIRFPRISNFTDFNVFDTVPGASVRYATGAASLGKPDLIILPGTKNTMEDLIWLRETGLEPAILKLHKKGTPVFGICGGYQMMGEELWDEDGTECGIPGRRLRGLGFFHASTAFRSAKVRTQVSGRLGELPGFFAPLSGQKAEGYEIHMGETVIREGAEGEKPLFYPEKILGTEEFEAEGEIRTGGLCTKNAAGTYLHGIFDGGNIASLLVQSLLLKKGVKQERKEQQPDRKAYREKQYDLLADVLRSSLDMKQIYRILDEGGEAASLPNHMEELMEISPSDIENKSFEIIGQEMHRRDLPPEEELVLKRVIHTTADFEYERNLIFSPDAVKKGMEALRRGAVIVTDTNMGRSGVNQKSLSSFGGEVRCFMADADVAEEAKKRGVTRAAVSMERAAALNRECIIAVGNAPTALVRLCELIEEGKIRPALIIGVPVGFVNVVQSKEMVLQLRDIPFIVARGRKGGSNVAAAILNALIYQVNRVR